MTDPRRCRPKWLEVIEVVDDLGTGPVLGGDKFSAQNTFAVDDVGFGDLDGSI